MARFVRTQVVAGVAWAFAALAGPAQASLIGDQVEGFAFFHNGISANTATNLFNDTFSPVEPQLATVMTGVPEYVISNPGSRIYSVDIDASSVVLTLEIADGVLDIGNPGYTMAFHDLDWLGEAMVVTGFQLLSSDFVSCPFGVSVQFCEADDIFAVPFSTSFTADSVSFTFAPGPILTYRFNEPIGDKRLFTAEFQILTAAVGESDVPAPAATVLFGGLAGLLLARRRRRG